MVIFVSSPLTLDRYQNVRKDISTYSLLISAVRLTGSFPFVPPSLVGAYYLHPSDVRAIFLHNDVQCNGTCCVTGGGHNVLGGA